MDENGKYVRIAPGNLPGEIDGTIGCGRFNASGMPTTPEYKANMVRRNPKAESIPLADNAFDRDFDEKMTEYPHVNWWDDHKKNPF